MLLRLDPAVHDALALWASDELRSANAQIEFLLRQALEQAGRLPGSAAPIARRGRPPKRAPEEPERPPGEPRRPPEEPERPPGEPRRPPEEPERPPEGPERPPEEPKSPPAADDA